MKTKKTKLAEIKVAVYGAMGVKTTAQVKRIVGKGYDLRTRNAWESLLAYYRDYAEQEEPKQEQKSGRKYGPTVERDWWEVLGVSASADYATVKIAYRKLALKYHPDRGGDSAMAQEINSAWATYTRRHAA